MSCFAHRRLRAAAFVAAASIAVCPAWPQKLPIETFSEIDELPRTDVLDLAQDPEGRMWFATGAGVTVYDGRTWQTMGGESGLNPRARAWIVFDAEGTAWSLSRAPAIDIARLEGGRWVPVPLPPLPDGCLLGQPAISGGGAGARLAIAASCGPLVHADGSWRWPDIGPGRPERFVRSLRWHEGRLLAATGEGLLDLGNGDAGGEWVAEVPRRDIASIAIDTCGSGPCLWLVGREWLGRLERDRFREVVRYEPDLAFPGVRPSAAADGNGGLYFANQLVLRYFHPSAGVTELGEAQGLASRGAQAIVIDREGGAWVAGRRGVSRIASLRFANWHDGEGLLSDDVSAILQRRDGSVVLGHPEGLTFLRDGRAQRLRFDGSPAMEHGLGRVLDLAEDADGTLWIAGNMRGLGRLAAGRVEWTLAGEMYGVATVLVDRAGRRWFSWKGRVLVHDDGGTREVPILRGSGVRRLVEGASGAIYACTIGDGLLRVDEPGAPGWLADEPPSRKSVFAVLERPNGALWIGTGDGLIEAVGETVRVPEAPRIDRPVYFMLDDAKGRTWFGTDSGVFRWDGSRLVRFTLHDGLAGREANRAAALLDRLGQVWMGTTGGLTVYRPELDHGPRVSPGIALTGLKASGIQVPLSGPVRLAYDQDDLVFEFRVVSFASGDTLSLQSRLDGFESDWSAPYTSADRLARYTNMPPGRYRFHVRVAGADGAWSAPASSPEIRIVGPFWVRPWFWFLAFLAAAAVGFTLQRQRYQSRYARRLEREVLQRVEELREVETQLAKTRQLQSLGLLAGGIAHDFNNLLTVVLGHISLLEGRVGTAEQRHLAGAAGAIARARELTAQLLTFSRGGAPVRNPGDIADVIRDSASFVLSGANVRCELDLARDLPTVSMDAGQISQVLNNLLINAMQAMPDGGVVRIVARAVEDPPGCRAPGCYVAVRVQDEGCGIVPESLQRVFDPYFTTKPDGVGLGLATAHSIVNKHDGALSVESRPGEGAAFTMLLPSVRAAPAVETTARPSGDVKGLRVLVMDDDPAVREVLSEMLERQDCRVVLAADGAEAIARYREQFERGQRFDAVVLDLTVPGGMGGNEALARMREIDPDVRAIVASGYAHAPVMAEYRARGFRAIMRKPFETGTLVEALREAVDR